MVNKLLITRAKEGSAAKKQANEEAAQKIEENKLRAGYPRMHYLTADEPFIFTFLNEPDLTIEIPIHFHFEEGKDGKAGRMYHYICERLYEDNLNDLDSPTECKHCNTLSDQGFKDKPKFCRVATVFAHQLEGKTGLTSKGKEFNYNPVVNIPIRPGKAMAGFDKLDALAGGTVKGRPGVSPLDPGVFIYELLKTGKGKDTQYHPISVCNVDILGDEFDPNSPGRQAALKAFAAMTKDEKYQNLLCSLDNVKWDIWGIDEPKPINVESSEDKKTPTKKSKDELK